MESFIHFLITHNAKIIYVSAAFIAILSTVVVWWQIFGKKVLKTDSADNFSIEDIEASLRKILSQTQVAIQNVSAQQDVQTGSGSNISSKKDAFENNSLSQVSGVLPAELLTSLKTIDGKPIADLQGIKIELEARASIIEGLQKKVEEAKSSEDSSGELLAKIKTLESKLLEYEIIEDDIADLSLFKEENAKLKAELENLKRGGAKLVDQFAEAMAEEEAADAASGESPSEDLLDAVASKNDTVEVTKEEANPETEQSSTIESVGDDENATTSRAMMTDTSAVNDEAKADIFGEFSAEDSSDDPLAALGDIDPDKMLDELKDLNADVDIGIEALDEQTDINKMSEEAKKLT